MLRKYFYLGMALLFLGITLIWSTHCAPLLKKIPNNFFYSADILSLDNLYDAQLQKFEGQQISKTTFSYKVVKAEPDLLTIQNLFFVRKLNNEPIFSVMRRYYIDPYTGQHVNKAGVEARSGTLFAPRYINKKDFDYWHVNYDTPAHMTFVNEETIDNVAIAHYQAQYHSDQTANLHYLPGVGTERGINTDITLDLWIEPISGWLVKYQDRTLAYYYDKKTGTALYPWNSFSNRYTENSIHQQLQHAWELKWKILFADFIMPVVLLLITVLFFLLFYLKINLAPFWQKIHKLPYKRYVLYPSGIAVLLFLLVYAAYIFYQYNQTPIAVVGISYWNDSPEYQEAVKGFKDGLAESGYQQGNNILFIEDNPHANIEEQIKIIQTFLNKKVNLIFVLTTPGTLIAKGITKETPIVFSVVTYPKEANLVDSLVSSNNNLVGTRNYIAPALQFRQFEELFPNTKVLGFVHRKGEPNSSIQFAEYQAMLNKRGIKVLDIAAVDLVNLQQLLLHYKDSYNALFLACDTLVQNGGGKIIADFALHYKIPSFGCSKSNVLQGALTGDVADFYVMGKSAGKKAALILNGADPSWLRTDYSSHAHSMINLLTAKQLGIIIPQRALKNTDYFVRDGAVK